MEPVKNKAGVFIVDDHPIFRDGLIQLVNKEDDLYVCGQTDSAEDAIGMMDGRRPDILIVDVLLKNGSGLELTRRVTRRFRTLPVLVISMYDDPLFAERLLQAGARGYIVKKETTEKVIGAIRQVLNGGMFLSESMLQGVLVNCIRPHHGFSSIDSLSRREVEVLNLIGQGMTNRAIAGILDLKVKTISSYRERIKNKLNLKSAIELNRYAIQRINGNPLKRKYWEM